MTDVKSNFWGRYTEDDLRKLKEEEEVMEMRWHVFEKLYDETRHELEKVKYAIEENITLRRRINELEANEFTLKSLYDDKIEEITKLQSQLDSLLSDTMAAKDSQQSIDFDGMFSEISQTQL